MLHCLLRRYALPPRTQLRRIFFFSTGTSDSSSGATASPDPHFRVDFLVNACGFSSNDASKVSKSLPRFLSADRAEAVLGFFRSHGLDGVSSRRLINWQPNLLGWDVETKLAPKFKFLRDLGFSESDAVKVVMKHPFFLFLDVQKTLLPRLKFWESFFGSREILLKILRRGYRFLSNSIENVVRPNLNFLRDECGIPEDRVSLVIKRDPGFIVLNPNALRALVDRTERLGVPRESGMFLWVLYELHGVSEEKFEAQLKLMNSFGWSNSDFITAIKRQSNLLSFSIESLRRKMEFLVNDVGITPSDIANNPTPLNFSLEKTLIPRFHVMEILKSEGLWTSTNKLRIFFSLTGPKFLQKFVLRYKDKVPKLLQVLCGVAEFKGNNPNCE